MSMIGKKLKGRYEILAYLGEGATSTVYKGWDSLLEREIALKILLPHVRDTTRKRFFQEAMSAARLNHPNIMAIYDRGDDDDRHFLVIEYVDGDPLTHYIPCSPEILIELGTQIALALDYAHERDIIHRDIKPANIKVTPAGQVKIMDLGLARPREAKRVTAPGMVIGTPAYISPEQAQGQPLDRRTDIYSLGIVLYEMATGQLPFNADDITALLLQHVQQPVPPPRLVNEALPEALERVILKTLEKNPSRRYPTGRALAESLQAVMPDKSHSTTDAPNVAAMHERTSQTDRLRDPARSRKRVIRIVMADDHVMVRRAIASLLEANEDFVVLAEAGDGASALSKTLDVMPDVLLLDLNMPVRSGLDILPEVRKKAPDVKVLVLSGREDDLYIMRALRAGAHGYILKSTDEAKLIDAIRKVVDDEIVLGKGVAEKIVGGLAGGGPDSPLSEIEYAMLLHVAAGYNDEELGTKLGMSTTERIEIMASIMNKLRVLDRNAAALTALRRGILKVEDLHDLPGPALDREG